MRSWRLAAIALALACPAEAASTATLQITVTGIADGRGDIRVALCPEADFLHPACPYVGRAPSRAGSVTVTIAGIPPGLYAAQAFQDANDNGRIDRNLLGIPEEGIGFSRDAPFRFGPPRFADAEFRLGPGAAAISFRLRYF
jgi:uncharacterized protein (DUF2141 family)